MTRIKALRREIYRSLRLLLVGWHFRQMEQARSTANAYRQVAKKHRRRAWSIFNATPPSLYEEGKSWHP